MEAILFDFGGTLDSNGISCREIFYSVYKNCGLDIDINKFDRAFYDADDNLPTKHNLKDLSFEQTFKLQITNVLENLQLSDDALAQKILNAYLTKTRRYFKQNMPILAELKKNYKLGVISNFFGNLDSVLKSEGLLEYFDTTIDSQIIKYVKPEPEIFLTALNKLKVPPQNTVMVGDSVQRDIKGALALKMRAALLWGDRFKTAVPPENLNDVIILKNLTELTGKLKEQNPPL